jgi:hypothetical protein
MFPFPCETRGGGDKKVDTTVFMIIFSFFDPTIEKEGERGRERAINSFSQREREREMARTTLDFSSTLRPHHPTAIIMIPSSSFSLTNIPNHHHYTLLTSSFITNIIIIHHTFTHDDYHLHHHKNHSKPAQEQAQEEDLNEEDKPYFHQLDYI